MVRRVRNVVAVIGIAVGLLVISATSSWAHAELVKTTPSASASLDAPPERVVLEFDDSVRIPNGGLRVINESSKRLAIPSPVSSNGGRNQSVILPPLPPGAYVVSWRVVSSDGHPLRGAFTFRVGRVGNQAAVAALAEKLLGTSGGPAGIGFALAVLRFLMFCVTLLLIGALGFVPLVLNGLRLRTNWNRRIVRFSGMLAGICGLATVLLYGPYVGGYGFGRVTDGTLLDDTLGDPVGQALLVKAIALVLLSVVATSMLVRTTTSEATADTTPITATKSTGTTGTTGAPKPGTSAGLTRIATLLEPVNALALLIALVVLVAEVFSGHGNSGPHPLAAAITTIVHVAAAGLWIGGLVHVALAGGFVRRETPSVPKTDATVALRRFSDVAFASVIALVATGLFASWRQVGSVQAATETTYGRLLIVKVVVVAAIVTLGGRARRTIRVNQLRREPTDTSTDGQREAHRLGAATPGNDIAMDRGISSGKRMALGIEIARGIEIALGAVVILVTSLLVNVAPAREAVGKPIGVQLTATSLRVDLTVDPARKGRNAIHIYTLKPTGEPLAIHQATLFATKSGADIEPIELRVLRAGPNHFQVLNADLPFKGKWILEVVVDIDEFTEERTSAEIDLR